MVCLPSIRWRYMGSGVAGEITVLGRALLRSQRKPSLLFFSSPTKCCLGGKAEGRIINSTL